MRPTDADGERVSENFAENLVDGHRVLPVLLEDLRAAEDSIHLATFLFFNDPIGKELARILCEKARAGVKVRVLMNIAKTHMGDPFSTGEQEMMEQDPDVSSDEAIDSEALAKWLREAGVTVLDSNLDFDLEVKTEDAALLRQHELILKTSRWDAMHVDHRKLIVIDGRVGYCGSANLGAQYLFHHPFNPELESHEEARRLREAGDSEPWWKWHDGLVRLEGPIVSELDSAFRERWVLDGGEDYGRVRVLPPRGPARGIRLDGITLFKNQPDSQPNAVRELFLREIRAAREEIFITSPYLYHPEVIAALIAARRRQRGMRIDLIVPAMEWNDNAYSQDQMQHQYQRLLRAGVKVFEYQNHFTHLKLAAFDGRVSIVGSANLNYRSLENDMDFELVARLESAEFARTVLAVRDEDVKHSVEMKWRKLGFRMRHRAPQTVMMAWRRLL